MGDELLRISDRPHIHDAIERLKALTDEDFHGYRSEVWGILAQLIRAVRRDALADPELLTAAWLHGADHARRKARWPEPTDAVVEQLARAMRELRNDEREREGWPRRAWESYSPESQAEFIAQAAAVLRRLREQEGGIDE